MPRKARFYQSKRKDEKAKKKTGRPVKNKRGPKKKTLSMRGGISQLRISRIENAAAPATETPILQIRPLVTSSPKVTVSLLRVPSPKGVFEGSVASPIAKLTPVLSDTTFHCPPIISKQSVQSSAPRSSPILITRIEGGTPSGGESPVHVRQWKSSTTKVSITLESAEQPNQTVDDCKIQADVVESQIDSGSVDDLERSTADFDPEAEENVNELFGDGRPSLWEESCSHRGSETVPFPDDTNFQLRFEDKDLTEALSVELRSRVPPGWKFYFGEGRVYVVLMVPNPLRYLPQRVIHAAFSGGIITVQVHLETLSEEHEIYRHTLMKPIVPLTPASVRHFSIILCKAVIAVQMHKICIGVDIPQCVDESQKHPDCILDTNKFEETGYDKALRTKKCSYLISRRSKRCSNCALYLEAVKRREERRLPDDVVHPKTRHNILTPTQLKQKLRDKEKTIRSQQAKLVRMRSCLPKCQKASKMPPICSNILGRTTESPHGEEGVRNEMAPVTHSMGSLYQDSLINRILS